MRVINELNLIQVHLPVVVVVVVCAGDFLTAHVHISHAPVNDLDQRVTVIGRSEAQSHYSIHIVRGNVTHPSLLQMLQ